MRHLIVFIFLLFAFSSEAQIPHYNLVCMDCESIRNAECAPCTGKSSETIFSGLEIKTTSGKLIDRIYRPYRVDRKGSVFYITSWNSKKKVNKIYFSQVVNYNGTAITTAAHLRDSLVECGKVSNTSLSGGSDTLDFGNYLYVSTSGDNATAVKGDPSRAWRTPWGAKSSALPGELVYVFAGTYTTGGIGTGSDVESDTNYDPATNLWKDSVTYYFDPGAVLVGNNYDTTTLNSIDQPFFYVTGTNAETCTVKGFGEFYTTRGWVENQVYAQTEGNISTVVTLDNPNVIFFMEGKVLSGRDLSIWINDCKQVNFNFEKGRKGWRELYLSGATDDLAFINFDAIDGSVLDTSLLIMSSDGLSNPNATKAIMNVRQNQGSMFFQSGTIYMESSGAGLTNYGGGNPQRETTHTIKVGQFDLVDVFKKYDPNPAASVTLNFNGVIPVDGDNFTVGSQTYTWVNTLDGVTPNQILVQGSLSSAASAVDHTVNTVLNGGVTWNDGGVTVAHSEVLAVKTGNNVLFLARYGGTAGNSIVSTIGSGPATFDSATLVGGLDDGTATAGLGNALLGGTVNGDITHSVYTIDCNTLISDFALLDMRFSSYDSIRVNIHCQNAVVSNAESACVIGLSGVTSSTDGVLNLSGNILNRLGPVFTAGFLPLANTNFTFHITGRFETQHATSPVINNVYGSTNTSYPVFANSTFVTPHTESIVNAMAQSYIIMNTYANKAVDINTTEVIEPITVNLNVR